MNRKNYTILERKFGNKVLILSHKAYSQKHDVII